MHGYTLVVTLVHNTFLNLLNHVQEQLYPPPAAALKQQNSRCVLLNESVTQPDLTLH